MTHKNDPGVYTTTCFNPIGRRVGSRTFTNFTRAQAFADRWARVSNGSAVVNRCLYNTHAKLIRS